MTDMLTLDIKSLLPKLLRSDEDIAIMADIFSAKLTDIYNRSKLLSILSTLEQQSDEVLAEIAWQRHIEGYSMALSRTDRENIIRKALLLHIRKGTVWSLETALTSLGYESKMSEWFEYGGDPYTFKIDITAGDRGLTEQDYDDYINIVNAHKNVRSSFEIVFHSEVSTLFMTKALCIDMEEVRVNPLVSNTDVHESMNYGIAVNGDEIITVYPQEV